MEIKIGCCGFPLARRRYFETFGVVEIQRTFYQPPLPSTAVKWRSDSPPGFEYTIKAWQLITHDPRSPTYRRLKEEIPESRKKNYGFFKPTDEVLGAWLRTEEIADLLDSKVIVFQCPASFEPTGENRTNMERFFSTVSRNGRIFAWEPRGRWKENQIEELCRKLDLVHVVDPFRSRATWGRIRYYRLHGIGGYRYRYTGEDLVRLKDLASSGIESYFMFNNVHMFENAREFKELMKRNSAVSDRI